MGVNYKLKGARAEKACSQERMAQELGINRLTYGQKENGIYDFSETEISKICKILGKQADEIFFNE